ncbi:MAG TPA: hypothetical protein VKR60_00075 [Candidatus Sulfotelmatobacter sp.]|nr:hypothetical protein [Candidatus Sulfotelmatobacter sp.]
MIKKTSAARVAALFLIYSLVLSAQIADPSGVMDRRMRSIAGPQALNCGRVEIGADDKTALTCAWKAVRKKQPFFVRYDLQGIDSFVSVGFAGNDDQDVYMIQFDSYGSDVADPPDERHNVATKCPRPVQILKMTSQQGARWYSCIPLKTEKR